MRYLCFSRLFSRGRRKCISEIADSNQQLPGDSNLVLFFPFFAFYFESYENRGDVKRTGCEDRLKICRRKRRVSHLKSRLCTLRSQSFIFRRLVQLSFFSTVTSKTLKRLWVTRVSKWLRFCIGISLFFLQN